MPATTQDQSDVAVGEKRIESRGLTATEEAPEANEATDEETTAYLDGWALWSLTVALTSSAFMLSLDNTILATAIPRITSDFNSLNDIGWYASAYRITQMALLPTCGRIFTLYDVKWSYTILLLVFEIGSVICAIAQNSVTLIVGRAVSGIGAAGSMGGAAIIVSYCLPLVKRPVLMGFISLVYGIGSILGPLVGGVFTDNATLTWRFCFWINLPFGAIALAQIWYTLRKPPPAVKAGLPPREKIRQLDLPGATVLIASVVCLMLALQWGGIVYPWSDAKVYGCFIGFGLLLTLFVWIQIKDQNSCTVPLHLFRNRTVCASTGFMLFLQLAVAVQAYYWPIYFQSVKDTSARDSGIYMFPFAISSTVCTLACGWIVSKVGYYVPFMWIGTPILAVGVALFQFLDLHSHASRWVGYQIITGIGFGVCGQVPIVAVQAVSSKENTPTVVVLVLFFESLGGALATSIAQNVFTDSLLRGLGKINGVDGAAVVEAGVKDFRRLIPSQLLDQVVRVFGDAMRNVFWSALASLVVALLISIAMEWRKLSDVIQEGDAGVESA
ncbi:MFS general substrate transporter [Westerdykella ornata]|uniref:MFS general substrate transporter n=1 Tax=Westerdykella ornata TaxID=318751 RepID=A0A6A6JPJ8_WESOR|nr:MFS general substrate transporter [Westerdykella ornata]KAF2276879.1 MFS general substrate transporter [Westerdykella ornata]